MPVIHSSAHPKILSILGVVLAFQNCSHVSFGDAVGNESASTGTALSIQKFQPALALRDASCIGCHAQIQGNLITDLGYPNPWFLGSSQDLVSIGATHYLASSLQVMDYLNGQILVPDAQVPNSVVTAQLGAAGRAPASDMQLVDYFSFSGVMNFGGSWFKYFQEATPTNFALSQKVNPTSGKTPVASVTQVYIGAPTAEEILEIVPGKDPGQTWVQVAGAPTAGLDGLTVTKGKDGTLFIESTSDVDCAGKDVVVNGSLLLNEARLSIGLGGCRFYVTGTVFVVGWILYNGVSSPTDNLQITSAQSIIMGVGLDGVTVDGEGNPFPSGPGKTPLWNRLLGNARANMVIRAAPTSADYQNFAETILEQAANIGLPLLRDASVPSSHPTALSAAKQARMTINFRHVLLNAPIIHSRYLGNIQGVIIAESAVFSLGEFSFQFDPVFTSVPILPALKYDVLCTGNGSVPCRPTAVD